MTARFRRAPHPLRPQGCELAPHPIEKSPVYPWRVMLGSGVYVAGTQQDIRWTVCGGELKNSLGFPHLFLEDQRTGDRLEVPQVLVSTVPLTRKDLGYYAS